MKKIFSLLTCLLGLSAGLTLHAQNTQLTGTMVGPSGTPFNGYLYLTLSQQGAAISPLCSASGAPTQVLPNLAVLIKISNGSMVSPPKVWGADCMNPPGIPYNIVVRDINGNELYNDQWLIQGSTFDIGTAVSVLTPSPGNGTGCGSGNCVVTNPTSNQIITQPINTAFQTQSSSAVAAGLMSIQENTDGTYVYTIKNVGTSTASVIWNFDKNGNLFQNTIAGNGGYTYTASGSGGTYAVTVGGGITLQAGAALNMSGASSTDTFSGTLGISAGTLNLNSSTDVNITGSGYVNLTAGAHSVVVDHSLVVGTIIAGHAGSFTLTQQGGGYLTQVLSGSMTSGYTIVWPLSSSIGALYNDGSGNLSWNSTVGSVSSVALSAPSSVFGVAGSPITTSGTLALSFLTQNPNTALMGPASGSAAVPVFRTFVSGDIPPVNLALVSGANGGVTGCLPVSNGGSGQCVTAPSLVAGTGVAITGSWPNQTISLSSSGSTPTTIGFPLSSGVVGTNVAAVLPASHNGTVTRCVIAVKSADPSVALTIKILQNGVDVFTADPTISGGSSPTTGPGSLYVFTALTSSPLTVTRDDIFTINVTSGNNNWAFTTQLE